MKRPIIFTFVACYLPGFKSGGPVRTIANMVEHLGDAFDFRIVCRDRDALDSQPYSGVVVDDWNRVGGAQVYYASPRSVRLRAVGRLLRETSYDVLYLNSFFNYQFTTLPLLARRLGLAPKKPCVIAPRGEFSSGALALKAWKKVPYLHFARAFKLYSGLIWQASSPHEENDIQREFGQHAHQIIVASDLPPLVEGQNQSGCTAARSVDRPLRIVFLSRITPKKNLDFALRTISSVPVPVTFNIYGPIRDETCWQQCLKLIAKLPEHISVVYQGSITPDKVPGVMAEHDLFFLPTLGENYGHVIPEALAAGTPVLISDTTPWRDLAQHGVGWDVPLLAGEEAFRAHIMEVAQMPPAERNQWRRQIAEWTVRKLTDPGAVDANRRLFSGAARS